MADYRESEDDIFEAISLLSEAMFYLQPSSFSQEGDYSRQAEVLRMEVEAKQGLLRMKLKKPLREMDKRKELEKEQDRGIKNTEKGL